MKFIKSNLAKKLIIILVVIIVSNTIIPPAVQAFDLGGILLQPVAWLCLGVWVPLDVTVGLLLNGVNVAFDSISVVVNTIAGNTENATGDIQKILQKIFIGPDTIFCGSMAIFNANIFDHIDEGTLEATTLSKAELGELFKGEDILIEKVQNT